MNTIKRTFRLPMERNEAFKMIIDMERLLNDVRDLPATTTTAIISWVISLST